MAIYFKNVNILHLINHDSEKIPMENRFVLKLSARPCDKIVNHFYISQYAFFKYFFMFIV